jgi:hypothetical protein
MKEAADALSFFASGQGTWRFFALLFPGIVAVAVYDLRVPGERRNWSELGIALVASSVVIDVFSAAYLAMFPIAKADTADVAAFGIIGDVIVPVLLGWLIVDLRGALARRGVILPAVPKAWDEFFDRIKGRPVALVLTLSDGRKIGGFWDEDPFASSYPHDEDLLITIPAIIDQQTGRFSRCASAHQGLLVKRDDIITIEAFDAGEMAATMTGSAAPAAPELFNEELNDG